MSPQAPLSPLGDKRFVQIGKTFNREATDGQDDHNIGNRLNSYDRPALAWRVRLSPNLAAG